MSHSMEHARRASTPRSPTADPRSRAEAARPLADPAAWRPKSAGAWTWWSSRFPPPKQPPEEGTDLNAALARAGRRAASRTSSAVVLLSDGDWNSGQPPSQAALRLRMRNVPVFAVPLGSESRLPDVALTSFDVPTFAVAGKPLRVPFTIESSLPRDEPATLEMRSSTGEVVTKDVVIPAMSRLQDVDGHGGPSKPGEVHADPDRAPGPAGSGSWTTTPSTAPLSIRKEQLRVLVMESFPRWEFRYLRNALERDPGVAVNCVLFQPDLGRPGAGKRLPARFPQGRRPGQIRRGVPGRRGRWGRAS